LVLAIDHHDGSCPYTENKEGTKTWTFDIDAPQFDYSVLNQKLATRASEITQLIDDMTCENFCKKALKLETIKLDYNKLTVAGHSFGGATALKVATQDFRTRCVLTLDPWMFPMHKQINDGNFKIPNHVPIFLLNTHTFHKINKPLFDHFGTF
jgi:platelet-activating factor acetylhydrolase